MEAGKAAGTEIPGRTGHRLSSQRTAIVLILCLLFSCGTKTPPKAPDPAYNTAPPVFSQITTVSLPVEVPISVLENQLNTQLGASIYEDNSLDDNGGDNLMLKVQKRQPAKLGVKGNIVSISVPIHVWAKAGYRVDKFGLTVGKYEETSFDMDVNFLAAITITPDWKVQTKTDPNGYTWIKKPSVTLAGFDIPITGIVERIIDEQQKSIAKAIDDQIEKNFNLKDEVAYAWKLMQEPIQVNEQYKAWLKLTPQEVLMAPLAGQSGVVKLNIAIRALAETVLGAKPMTTPKPNVPPLKIQPNLPQGFDVALLAKVPWSEARRLTLEQVSGQTFTFQEGKRQIRVLDLDVYGQGPRLVIGTTLEGSLNGKIYLKGEPVYEKTTQTVRLKNVDFDLDTRDRLAKTANWLLHGQFVRKMEPYFALPIGPQLEQSRTLLRQNLAQNKVRDNIVVQGNLTRLDLDTMYLTADGIEVILKAGGDLKVRVDGF